MDERPRTRRGRERRRSPSGRPDRSESRSIGNCDAEPGRHRRMRKDSKGHAEAGATAHHGQRRSRKAAEAHKARRKEGKGRAYAEGTLWPSQAHDAPIPTQALGGCRKAREGGTAVRKENAQAWRRQPEARRWTRGRQQTSPPGRPSVPNLGAAPQCTSRPAAGETETPRRPPAWQGALCHATAVAQAPTRPGRVRHARTTAGDEPSGERQQGRRPRQGGEGQSGGGSRRRPAGNCVAAARKRRRDTVAGK